MSNATAFERGPAPFDLTGRTAIVTGGTRGIGHAIVAAFANAGANVLFSSEDAGDVGRAERALNDGGACAIGVTCDVRDDAAQAMLVDRATDRFGGLDVLVCNAGVAGHPGSLAVADMADFDRVMAIDLRSMVVLAKLALPRMTSGGSVILLSSIAGLRGNGAIGAYAIAKAGVAQLARNLAIEWGPRGIRVNAISPGLIRTGFSEALISDAAFMARRMAMTPLRRPGEPHEVAGAALFLASGAGGFVSGHNLVVDGGTIVSDGS